MVVRGSRGRYLARASAWIVLVAVASYLVLVHPSAGYIGLPYWVTILLPGAGFTAAWMVAADLRVGRRRRAVAIMAALVLGAVLLAAAWHWHALPHASMRRSQILAGAVLGPGLLALAAAVGWSRRRPPSVTELLVMVTVATMVDTDFLAIKYGFLRDLGLYLRAGDAFLAGTPVYTEVPLTQAVTDPTLSPFLYPPLTVPFFAVLALLPRVLVQAGWLLGSLAASVGMLRWFGVRWRWVPVLLLWPPFVQGLWVGNADIPVLIFFAAATARGALVVVPGIFKPQLAVAGLWLVRERQWRSIVVAVGALAAGCLVTLPIVGTGAWVSWARALVAFGTTTANLPAVKGLALAHYVPAEAAIALGLAAVAVALTRRGRDGLTGFGLASLAVSPTLYQHGFALGLPAFLPLPGLALWATLAVTSTFYNPQGWWWFVALALVAPHVPALRRTESLEGDAHPLGPPGSGPGDPSPPLVAARA